MKRKGVRHFMGGEGEDGLGCIEDLRGVQRLSWFGSGDGRSWDDGDGVLTLMRVR